MFFRPVAVVSAAIAALGFSAPASAQFFLKPVDLSGVSVTEAEPGLAGPVLTGATPAELRAMLVWNLRAALNVAALQCTFEPTLLAPDNYNALLDDHKVELANSLKTVEKYFNRTIKNKKTATTEFDRFLTRVYSSFSTVSGQLSFCQTAASIGQDAAFVPRGKLADFAAARMRELRASLAAWGEQQFRSRNINLALPPMRPLPPFGNERCWRRNAYQPRKCGKLS